RAVELHDAAQKEMVREHAGGRKYDLANALGYAILGYLVEEPNADRNVVGCIRVSSSNACAGDGDRLRQAWRAPRSTAARLHAQGSADQRCDGRRRSRTPERADPVRRRRRVRPSL